MVSIIENFNLKNLNTFGIVVLARYFVELEAVSGLEELIKMDEFRHNEKLFLGGGSNVLFTKDFEGIVVRNKIKGIEVVEESDEWVLVKSMGGEIWSDLVDFATKHGWWGIENLSLIPGTVGAAPIQNIGAYGVEIKDTLISVEALNIETGEKKIFQNNECKLGYRDSIFKNELKDRYFIVSITLRLSKVEKKNIEYKVLKEYLEQNNIKPRTSKIISEAVTEIRRSKLPDPKILGNAGSFFKNTFVDEEHLYKLLKYYPSLPYFVENEKIKVPSAWLIENAGWKGKRIGNVGVHDKQALVLINHGGGTGEEIKILAKQIIKSVYDKFSVILTPEVNLI